MPSSLPELAEGRSACWLSCGGHLENHRGRRGNEAADGPCWACCSLVRFLLLGGYFEVGGSPSAHATVLLRSVLHAEEVEVVTLPLGDNYVVPLPLCGPGRLPLNRGVETLVGLGVQPCRMPPTCLLTRRSPPRACRAVVPRGTPVGPGCYSLSPLCHLDCLVMGCFHCSPDIAGCRHGNHLGSRSRGSHSPCHGHGGAAGTGGGQRHRPPLCGPG